MSPAAAADSVTADDEPGLPTRRELRARERALEQARAEQHRAVRRPHQPPLRCAPAHRGPVPPRKHTVRTVSAMLAMSFAAAIAVSTSIPAAALAPAGTAVHADAATARAVVRAAGTSTRTQSLTGDGISAAPIARDSFAVRTVQQIAADENLRTAPTFTNDPNGTIQWPFPVGVPIASYFGPRIAPTAGASTFHEGVDFDPGAGAPIHVIADGTVRTVQLFNDNGLGVYVIVDHVIDGKLVSSLYGHMRPGSVRVTVGEHLKVGDVVGLVGDTGISTGAHLHFQIMLGGSEPVDPYAWLKAHAN